MGAIDEIYIGDGNLVYSNETTPYGYFRIDADDDDADFVFGGYYTTVRNHENYTVKRFLNEQGSSLDSLGSFISLLIKNNGAKGDVRLTLNLRNMNTDNFRLMTYVGSNYEALNGLDELVIENLDFAPGYGLTDWIIKPKKKLTVKGRFDTSGFTDSKSRFSLIDEISGIERLDFRSCGKFYRCFYKSGVTELDLSAWNLTGTNLVHVSGNNDDKGCNYMFYGCSGLKSVKLNWWNSHPVKPENESKDCYLSLSDMFKDCSALETVDMSDWPVMDNGVSVSADSMFMGCSAIEEIDLSWMDPVFQMDQFHGCRSLRRLNVSGRTVYEPYMFAVSVRADVFRDCVSLTDIIGPLYGIEYGFDFRYSPLTRESVLTLFAALRAQARSGYSNLYLSQTSFDSLTEEDIASVTSRGYTVLSVKT